MDHSEAVYTVNPEMDMMEDPATETTELFCHKGWNGKRIPVPPIPKFLEPNHLPGKNLWLIPNPLTACTTDKEVFTAGEATMEWCPERKFLLKIPTMEGLYMGELMRSDYFYQNNVIKSGTPNTELVQNLLIEARRCIKLNIRRLRTVCLQHVKNISSAEYFLTYLISIFQRIHDMHQAEQKKRNQAVLAQGSKHQEESEDSEDAMSESEWMENPSQDSRDIANLVASMKRTSPEC